MKDLSPIDSKGLFGISGSPTWINKIYVPLRKEKKELIIEGSVEEKAKKIVHILVNLNVLG